MKSFTLPRPVNDAWSYGKRMAAYFPWQHLKNNVDQLVSVEMQSVRRAVNLAKGRAARGWRRRL